MKYYVINENHEYISESKEALEKLYGKAQELPEDYEEGKYTVENDVLVLNPNWKEERKQAEKERIAKLSLTKREVFLALYRAKALTPDMVRAQITDIEALIEFDYATEYYRFNPLIDKIGTMLGYTSEDLDYLFINKELPNNTDESEEE